MTTTGTAIGQPSSLAAVSVSAGGTANSATIDLGSTETPQASRLAAQFAVTGGATEGYDVTARIQWSKNGTTWPSDGEGAIVLSRSNSGAAASLTSQWVGLGDPKGRYARLQYSNANATEAITVSAEVAEVNTTST